jgi:hypothetical protein
MKAASLLFKNDTFCKEKNMDLLSYDNAQLVLGFGSRALVSDSESYRTIKAKFPNAAIALCSSSGEIYDQEVIDDSISLVAMAFQATPIQTTAINIAHYASSFDAGKALITQLPQEDLKLVFVLSDGGQVNGSELVKGMNSAKGESVLITGGLAGDGAQFEKTVVGLNQQPEVGEIVAIGFYGAKIKVSHGSLGGWESFGLQRTVTQSTNNVLSEIDHKNALELYKNYLGAYAEELPGSALLFPLSVTLPNNSVPVVRTILSIDNEHQTMTFAGDLPVGSKVSFMRANFDKLIDASSNAAQNCLDMHDGIPQLALLISCVGRKLILGTRIDEEIEAISDIVAPSTIVSGFYSYGEISPLNPMANCELHNQTMTVTCISEID